MQKCTYEKCDQEASHSKKSKNGEIWSNLCSLHHNELEKHTKDLFDPEINPEIKAKNILASWVKSSGGASELSKKICSDEHFQKGINEILKLKGR